MGYLLPKITWKFLKKKKTKKLNTKLFSDPAILLLGIYIKELKIRIWIPRVHEFISNFPILLWVCLEPPFGAVLPSAFSWVL